MSRCSPWRLWQGCLLNMTGASVDVSTIDSPGFKRSVTMSQSLSNSPITHVGYVGLGIMGSAMAANLLKAGFKVTVWNRTKSKAKPLLDAGALWADSPKAVASSG